MFVLKELQKAAPSYTAPVYRVRDPSRLYEVETFPSSNRRGDAYGLARRLGVGIENLPCITVFEDFHNIVEDLATVSIPNAASDLLKVRLRFLVSKMDECRDNPKGQRLGCLRAKLRNELIRSAAKGILKDAISDVLSAGTSRLVGLA